ncbi:MAG: hypothetical protein ABUL61_06390, partial [Oleiharenicola lentus]
MKIPPLLLVLGLAASRMVAADDAEALFAYDRSAPLNLQEAGRETRGGAVVRDITFTPAGSPVK